jgi:hypothetical protein
MLGMEQVWAGGRGRPSYSVVFFHHSRRFGDSLRFFLKCIPGMIDKGVVNEHHGCMEINPRNRPHDYFFRRTFDSVAHARDLLRTFVPAELLEGLQLDELRREKESFVSPAEAESVLDTGEERTAAAVGNSHPGLSGRSGLG